MIAALAKVFATFFKAFSLFFCIFIGYFYFPLMPPNIFTLIFLKQVTMYYNQSLATFKPAHVSLRYFSILSEISKIIGQESYGKHFLRSE